MASDRRSLRTTTSRFDRRVAIYLLIDPRTGAIRYVGRSRRPEKRNHGFGVEGWPLLRWLDELRMNGDMKPRMKVIATVDVDAAAAAERLTIFVLRSLGADLCNTQHNRVRS